MGKIVGLTIYCYDLGGVGVEFYGYRLLWIDIEFIVVNYTSWF